ncbi:MAG: hypothetical protein Q8J74_09110 [Candidatus Didemnitutus sp.]|nr:hypothetical protein [Candidatus Didemnitutus sp.]
MPASTPTEDKSTRSRDAAVLLPSEAFFVRRIALDPSVGAEGQVEIALETTAPFAVSQLYFGYLKSTDGSHALVFATHRRRFAEESWEGASAVLPAFAAVLGDAPSTPRIRVWDDGASLAVAGWDGNGNLPVVVLARPNDGAEGRAELVAEVQRRLGTSAPIEDFAGPAGVSVHKSGDLQLTAGTGGGGRKVEIRLDEAAVETMDVRDKDILAAHRQMRRRDGRLWLALQLAVGGLVVAGLLELCLLAGGVLLKQQRGLQAEVAPEVARIQTAQSLGTRIEELSQRRLRPFEMLAVLNSVRPAGVVFTRSVTTGQGGIDIEALTANADSVGVFETALRNLSMIETLEVRDLRLREGMTTFQLAATFKVGSLTSVTGSGGTP